VAAVEFLEPAQRPRPEEPLLGGPAVDGPTVRLSVAAGAVMWAAAAAFSLGAAFQKIYSLSYGTGSGRLIESLDGWGRVSVSGPISVDSTQYGPRYGIVFCACAAVFALLAVVTAWALVVAPAPRVNQLAVVVGVAGSAVLGGLLAGIVLHAQSTLGSARASVHREAGLGDPIRGDLGTSFGPCTWLGLAGLGCAALALALRVLTRPSPAPAEPAARPSLPPLLGADEELPDKGP
jgi:hypothetical protein